MTLVLIVLCLLMIARIARGHQVETINSFSVTNYTGYVIDSDAQWGLPEYNREDILTRAIIQYSTTNNFQTIYNYQIIFRLADQSRPRLWLGPQDLLQGDRQGRQGKRAHPRQQ